MFNSEMNKKRPQEETRQPEGFVFIFTSELNKNRPQEELRQPEGDFVRIFLLTLGIELKRPLEESRQPRDEFYYRFKRNEHSGAHNSYVHCFTIILVREKLKICIKNSSNPKVMQHLTPKD